MVLALFNDKARTIRQVKFFESKVLQWPGTFVGIKSASAFEMFTLPYTPNGIS